LAVTCQTWWCH